MMRKILVGLLCCFSLWGCSHHQSENTLSMVPLYPKFANQERYFEGFYTHYSWFYGVSPNKEISKEDATQRFSYYRVRFDSLGRVVEFNSIENNTVFAYAKYDFKENEDLVIIRHKTADLPESVDVVQLGLIAQVMS